MRSRGSVSAPALLLALTVALAAGACSSDERRPGPIAQAGAPPRGSEGGDGAGGEPTAGAAPGAGNGGHAAVGNAGNAGNGGASGDTSSGGTAGAAGDVASGGEPPFVNPDGPFTGPDPFPCDSDAEEIDADLEALCAPNTTWGAESEVASAAEASAAFIGVTPDERTLVWSEAAGSERIYLVADRSTASGPFGEPQLLDDVTVLAVSPDGLRLAALSPDQSALFTLSRSDRSGEFAIEGEGEFVAIDDEARENGWSFSSCVFSADDRTLFYTAGAPDSKYLLRVAERADDGPWATGTLIERCELEVHGSYGRYPTGVSADGQTLFFFDSWRGITRAAWRDPQTSAFSWFADIGKVFAAQPNAACDRLYFSKGGSAVLSAPAN